jgi:hypothetical protein
VGHHLDGHDAARRQLHGAQLRTAQHVRLEDGIDQRRGTAQRPATGTGESVLAPDLERERLGDALQVAARLEGIGVQLVLQVAEESL